MEYLASRENRARAAKAMEQASANRTSGIANRLKKSRVIAGAYGTHATRPADS